MNGIKISIPHVDVTQASDKDISLRTDSETLKVFKSGRIELTSAWNTVYHGLGYVPQFLVFTTDEDTDPTRTYMATADTQTAVARANTQDLFIRQEAAGSIAFYYIFYEPAE